MEERVEQPVCIYSLGGCICEQLEPHTLSIYLINILQFQDDLFIQYYSVICSKSPIFSITAKRYPHRDLQEMFGKLVLMDSVGYWVCRTVLEW